MENIAVVAEYGLSIDEHGVITIHRRGKSRRWVVQLRLGHEYLGSLVRNGGTCHAYAKRRRRSDHSKVNHLVDLLSTYFAALRSLGRFQPFG